MSEEIKKTKISSLTKAASFQTGDEVLFLRGTKPYRIDRLLLKGDKGDKFRFEDFSAADIRVLQQPALAAAESAYTAAQNANKAMNDANAAEALRATAENTRVANESSRMSAENSRVTAETSRVNVEKNRVTAESGRVTAENTRVANENARIQAETKRQTDTATAIKDAETATENASDAADRLNLLSNHRDKIVDGYWHRWDEVTEKWYNTGEIAKGNVMYATFGIDPVTGKLVMFTDPEYTGANFLLKNGKLLVEI